MTRPLRKKRMIPPKEANKTCSRGVKWVAKNVVKYPLFIFSMWQPREYPFWCEWFWGTLAAARSRPFIFNPLPSQCVLYSFRFRQSFPVHFKPKEKKRALFRGGSQEERRSFAGWERCIAKVIAKKSKREIEPPIHKNINSFAAAIKDKIYYQPAGRRPGRIPSWRLWEKSALSLSLAENPILQSFLLINARLTNNRDDWARAAPHSTCRSLAHFSSSRHALAERILDFSPLLHPICFPVSPNLFYFFCCKRESLYLHNVFYLLPGLSGKIRYVDFVHKSGYIFQ